MPLTIRLIDGIPTPCAICDHCGEPIVAAPVSIDPDYPNVYIYKNGVGNVDWARDMETGELICGPFLSHKGCSVALEARHRPPGAIWATMELDDYLARLIAVMELDLDEFQGKMTTEHQRWSATGRDR